MSLNCGLSGKLLLAFLSRDPLRHKQNLVLSDNTECTVAVRPRITEEAGHANG
jgi:hypothetical protein